MTGGSSTVLPAVYATLLTVDKGKSLWGVIRSPSGTCRVAEQKTQFPAGEGRPPAPVLPSSEATALARPVRERAAHGGAGGPRGARAAGPPGHVLGLGTQERRAATLSLTRRL